jgi:DNA polymerase-1
LGSLSFFIVSGNSPDKLLLLVDGSSYLYRAFHALPELKSPRGEPTGAIYGVLNMLRRLATDYKAQARACVFDAKGKTFRDDEYPEYKAHRPPMPDDLALQIEPLKEAIQALGWPVLTVDGVEADDVIATLAEQAKRRGWRCVISTGDKDLAQLVGEGVTLVNTMSNETLDAAAVQAKFGVAPERIVDYLALIGDAVDNVPGVPKVGPKTAAKWIAQYGSLDDVITHAGEIGGAVGENLRRTLDWLPKGRSLLTVRRDVALPVTVDALVDGEADRARQRELFQRFGFRTWLTELGEAGPEPQPSRPRSERRNYATVNDERALRDLVARLGQAGLVGFDTETTGLEPMVARLVGMSFAWGDAALYLPLAHEYAGAP